jgi:hypothetical protein
MDKKNKNGEKMKKSNYNWTPRYEVGSMYKSKLNNKRYYIEKSGSKTCALSVRILEDGVVLDLSPNAFDKRKENKNIFYGIFQKDLDKLDLEKIEERA